jgi:hypothetical protein
VLFCFIALLQFYHVIITLHYHFIPSLAEYQP